MNLHQRLLGPRSTFQTLTLPHVLAWLLTGAVSVISAALEGIYDGRALTCVGLSAVFYCTSLIVWACMRARPSLAPAATIMSIVGLAAVAVASLDLNYITPPIAMFILLAAWTVSVPFGRRYEKDAASA